MRKTTKKAARAAIIMLLCAAFLFTACAKGEYKKDVDTKEIADALSQTTPTESAWIDEDQNFIEEYIDIPDYVKESSVY